MADPKELAELQVKHEQTMKTLEETKAELAKFKKDDIEVREKLEKLEDDLEAARKDYAAKVDELQRLEVEKQADELVAGELITKAMRPYAIALLGSEKKEYSFGEGEKAETLSKFDTIKKVFELAKKSDVNLDESSEDLKGYGKKTDEDKMLAAAEKMAQEKKITFAQAYKEVMKETAEA